jgi:hypothetical protein
VTFRNIKEDSAPSSSSFGHEFAFLKPQEEKNPPADMIQRRINRWKNDINRLFNSIAEDEEKGGRKTF